MHIPELSAGEFWPLRPAEVSARGLITLREPIDSDAESEATFARTLSIPRRGA